MTIFLPGQEDYEEMNKILKNARENYPKITLIELKQRVMKKTNGNEDKAVALILKDIQKQDPICPICENSLARVEHGLVCGNCKYKLIP